jgi:uncharacterized protein (TIGR00369 family)
MRSTEIRAAIDGLSYFRKMLAGELAPPPMLQMFGIRLVEVEAGRVVFEASIDERFYNGTGVAHGGFAATLLDTALGCAINSTTSAGTRFTTLELKVNLTRALTVEVGTVRCEGRAIHVGRQTAVADARIVDRHGKLYAHGTTTCIAQTVGAQAPSGAQASASRSSVPTG